MATVTIAEETNTVTVSEDAETVTVVSGTFTVSSGGGGGATNLAYTSSASNGIVTSDTGTDATLPLATASIAGLLTPAQFSKLALLSGTNTGDQNLSSYATTAAVAAAYQPLATVLTNTTASFTTAQETKLSNLAGTNTGDQDLSTLLVKASNLSDLTNAVTARTNLGLGTLATQSGTFSGTSSGTNTGDQNLSGYALLSGNLSQFASTTSAQLRGVISDESGTGALLFSGGNIGDATGTSLTVTDSLTGETSLQSGVPTVSGGIIFFWNSGNSFFQGLSAKTGASGDVLIELPTSAGTTGQYLKTTTAGTTATLSWDNPGDVTKTGTQTLTNKTISGAGNTLTNIALSSLSNSTSLALGVGSVELGHASDTTISRVSAGVAAIEGANILVSGGNAGTPSAIVLTNATGLTANQINAPLFAADAGANDTYTATLSPAPSAYVTGNHYRFKANTANTGAATINFNTLGAITIVKAAGGITTALADNDIRSGQWVDLVYDGTNMQIQSTLGNAASGGSTSALLRGVALPTTFTAYVEEDFIFSGAQWAFSSAGTGAQSAAGGGTALYPGHAVLTGATSGSGYAGMRTATVNNILFNGLTWEWFARIKTASAVSDGTNTYSFFIGFGDASTALPTDGAYFLHNSSSGNWLGRTADNGSTTSASGGSNIAVAVDTWVDLRISINAAGTLVTFYVYDTGAWTSIGTCATNIPTGAARQTGISGAIIPTAGTLSRVWTIDKIISFAY